jgi:hypothetical protein
MLSIAKEGESARAVPVRRWPKTAWTLQRMMIPNRSAAFAMVLASSTTGALTVSLEGTETESGSRTANQSRMHVVKACKGADRVQEVCLVRSVAETA